MARYRQKAVIDAFQYDGEIKDANGHYCVPGWAAEAVEKGQLFYESVDGEPLLFTEFYGERQIVNIGDYLMNGQEFIFPVEADWFESTFEKLDE